MSPSVSVSGLLLDGSAAANFFHMSIQSLVCCGGVAEIHVSKMYELFSLSLSLVFLFGRCQDLSPIMVIHSRSLCLKEHLHTSVKMIIILESLL